jgi:hypothetical protein
LLDFHLALPGLYTSKTSGAIYPDLVDHIARIRTILEFRTDATPSLNELKLISPDSWLCWLKNVIWTVHHQNVTEEQRNEIKELRQRIIDTKFRTGDLLSGFSQKFKEHE